MNNLKCIILLLFSVLGLFANAEDEPITFTPSSVTTARTTTYVSGSSDEMSFNGISIYGNEADFSNRSNRGYYKLFAYSGITISAESRIKKVTLYKHSSSSNKFSLDTSNNYGIAGSIKTGDSNNQVIWQCGSYNVNSITFYCTFGAVVWISKIEVTVEKKTGEEITLSSLGYGTMYYGTKSLVVPSGIEAMTYTVSGNKLVCSKTYRAGETIPQATGVVLKGEAGTYTFNYSGETGVAPSGNLLWGSDAEQATSGAGLFYKLAQDPDNAQNVGFFWGADNGGAFTNAAHKAYLCVPASAGVRAFILLNEETTAINKLSTDIQTHETYYTLGGQQLSEKPAKGAVIVSKGKKFVVR